MILVTDVSISGAVRGSSVRLKTELWASLCEAKEKDSAPERSMTVTLVIVRKLRLILFRISRVKKHEIA